ncbi:hypothetical protein C8R44DRAFT_681407 [Mycena epipterygia]|nr:hypothetical protein C8R44DRAFT_681407 [Mycena epipterygia]
MSDHPEQPKSKFCDSVKDGWHKVEDVAHKGTSKLKKAFHLTPKRSPAPSLKPFRSPTPAPSNREGPPPGATPKSAPSRVDSGEDSLKVGDTAKTDTSDTAQSKPGSDLNINPYLKSTHALPDPDWQAWKIDADAIYELRKWGAGSANSNWRKVADTIDRLLKSETIQAVQDFIPDGPVPAKTLVKVLLSLVQLGIRVPVIQKKVYDFAQEAIEYIRTLVEVIDEEPAVKKDLEAICTAVNEICKWASVHVRKMTLSADDLGDWSSKFSKSKEMFLATTVLRIRVEQANDRRKDFIKEKLANHVATKHEYTDQSKTFCAPHTRVEIQKEIEEWLSSQTSSSKHIFWITGIAGSGKSTLSATVAETLRRKGTPVTAQFFISRNIPETIDPEKIIPTIAQQLSAFSPAAAHIIHDALKPGFISPRKEQVEKLLLAPIRELSKSCDVVIILIDALDELVNAAKSVQEMLLPIAPRDCDLPDNVRFIITSRPEHWAVISDSKTLDLTVFKQDILSTESSRDEVKKFIVARMKEITPEAWIDWPTKAQLDGLSDKADGLFHYAATALNWIENQIYNDGKACQNTVFDQFTLLGIGELEALYEVILNSFEDIAKDLGKDTDERARAALKLRRENRLCGFQHVTGTILVLDEPLTIHQIIAFLADIQNFDVKHFLEQFRSVLIPGMTALFEEATPQMHKSFRDYITSDHAPTGFHIHTGEAHFVTARSCLEIIVKAGSQSDVVAQYSVQNWYKHLRKAVDGGVTHVDERMWNLFGQMMEEPVVGIWVASDLIDLFVDVATAGLGLLKQRDNEDKMQEISNILIKAKALRQDLE